MVETLEDVINRYKDVPKEDITEEMADAMVLAQVDVGLNQCRALVDAALGQSMNMLTAPFLLMVLTDLRLRTIGMLGDIVTYGMGNSHAPMAPLLDMSQLVRRLREGAEQDMTAVVEMSATLASILPKKVVKEAVGTIHEHIERAKRRSEGTR
jgi:hypothetical protein